MGIKQDVYIGTYSLPIKFGTGEIFHGKGKGIYLYEFDTETAELKYKNVMAADNPSFLTINSDGKRLYAVNELKEFKGEISGAVSAFSIQDDGNLTLINQLATGGTDPCHVVLSPDKKHLIVSNYMSGSVSLFPILEDGSLGVMKQFIQYEGKGVDPLRQTCPHAHSAIFSKDSQYVYICDLGTDRVWVYTYSDFGYLLSDGVVTGFIASAGAGPRYAEFGVDGEYCYIINELDASISVATYNKENGLLTEVQKVKTLLDDADCKKILCADLHIPQDGRFIYATARGLDSIAIYHNNAGLLSLIGIEPSGGKTPRNFSLDATGNYLLCANQDSDNVIIFEIDKRTGLLNKKSEAYVPTPVCIKFLDL